MSQLQQSPTEEKWPVGKSAAIFTTVVIFLLALMDQCDRFIMASLLPFIKADLNLTDAQAGGLVSIVNLSIALLVIPCGYIVDKWSRKKMVALMGFVWSVACGAGAFCSNLSQLLISRFFVGAGESGYNPAASALLAAQYPKRHLSKAMSIVQFGMTFGVPLGMALGGILGTKFGWRHSLGIVAIPGLFCALLALFFKDYSNSAAAQAECGAASVDTSKKASTLAHLKVLFKSPSFWFILLAASGYMLVANTGSVWRPMYFVRQGGMTPAMAGTVSSIMLLIALIGALCAGVIIDLLRKKFDQAAAIVAFIGLLFGAGIEMYCYSGAVKIGSTTQIALFTIAGFGSSMCNVANMTMAAALVGAKIRATALGLLVGAQNLFGMAMGPLLAGILSDHFGGSLQETLFHLVFVYVLPLFCYLMLAAFTYKRDLARKIDEEAVFC
ncbi:MAG: MFS transporter [Mailhella sp.]|nr:MFS transporter [Mailhella sp.]